ncbi:succinyldiaminopimelate transaminase [Niveibacterium sp. 24ML]|uniref:succinyldiaminopimelate transaminase n=1 Tax=Niveibacterium sp. 24ML TaxID=2985512 RepID=UPI0022717C24|nr:succinyldiaminopimelate transaminase [Niveibacterium sp. 24ML]MCX9156545.1 succinyldiaminopimelate transaminase [Niveibacterium sp. 24ML]
MNPRLDLLQPYPFERLRQLFAGVEAPAGQSPVRLSIGEPQHATPAFIQEALVMNLRGLSAYPTTAGGDALRETIANWLTHRYGLDPIDPASEVLPVCGSREALFAFAQAIVDTSKPAPLVVSPNPFYQIYEGAALLAGAEPVFLDQMPEHDYRLDLDSLSDAQWQRVQLMFVCSPGNPTGKVLHLDDWKALFERADRYGFVIAADECYSEIYFDESKPPLGALQAAKALGRHDYERLVVFSSLSKRSNVPGLRSGFVAGDRKLLKQFLLYRTYHGCAMSLPVQAASVAAWRDESHVRENRTLYRQKFAALEPILSPALGIALPDAGFYFWARTPCDDREFARELFGATHVTVLPGQFLSRDNHGMNPGAGFVRIALVAAHDECVDAAHRIAAFVARRFGNAG